MWAGSVGLLERAHNLGSEEKIPPLFLGNIRIEPTLFSIVIDQL